MAHRLLRVGLIGCGNISGEYMLSLQQYPKLLQVAACADQDGNRAAAFSQRYSVPALTPAALLQQENIDLILNLTPPAAHFRVSLSAIMSGKHVYSEKPLAISLEEGVQLLDAAQKQGVLLGCAPDTFLGEGYQTCRTVLMNGALGDPVAASAFMMCHGHEDWHPAPDFYYKAGGGPLFDMGPYYLTALVYLLGPVRRVTAFAGAAFPERTVTSMPGEERRIAVETFTHYTISLELGGGVLVSMSMSFDIWHSSLPHLEIYGSRGTLFCPDPNTFEGPVRLITADGCLEELRLSSAYHAGRGAGLLDMVHALQQKRAPLVSAGLALHVLEVMTAVETSARSGQAVAIQSRTALPD